MNINLLLRSLNFPIDEIIDLIPDNKKILDLGCGNNFVLYNLLKSKKINSYTGIDLNISNYKELVKKDNISFIHGSIEDNIDLVSKFEFILMIDVLHHISRCNQKKIIYDILKRLKPNSIFIYKDISTRNIFMSFWNKLHDLIYNFQWIHYFTLNQFVVLIEKNVNKISYEVKYKRIFFYDHEFIIIKRV